MEKYYYTRNMASGARGINFHHRTMTVICYIFSSAELFVFISGFLDKHNDNFLFNNA